jgi:hypothetical protein
MALPLPVYIVVSVLSLEDRHRQTLIHSDYSILLDLVNQYHSTPIIHMPLQLSIRQVYTYSMFFFYIYKYPGTPFHVLIFSFEKYSDGFYSYIQEELRQFNKVGQSLYFVMLVLL